MNKTLILLVVIALIAGLLFSTILNPNFGVFYFSSERQENKGRFIMLYSDGTPAGICDNYFIGLDGRVRYYNQWVSFPFLPDFLMQDERLVGYGWFHHNYCWQD